MKDIALESAADISRSLTTQILKNVYPSWLNRQLEVPHLNIRQPTEQKEHQR